MARFYPLFVLVAFAAALACLILSVIALSFHPDNTVDLLAGSGVSAGAGLLALVARLWP
jgi:uncharacterized membrane protein